MRRWGLALRSALFWLGMIASTLVYAPLSLLAWPLLGYERRFRFIASWTRLNLWWLARCCGIRAQIEGRERLPAGNAIVLCKHQSAWETLALNGIVTPVTWVLKRELLWIPFFGWGLAALEPVAIDRSAGRRAVRQLVEQGTERLRAGRWVVIFPEGTRVAPGQRRRYGMGGAILAEQSGYPIVPMAHNAGLYWPRRGFIKHPGTVRLVIGPPIDSRGRSAAELLATAESWIERTTAELIQTR